MNDSAPADDLRPFTAPIEVVGYDGELAEIVRELVLDIARLTPRALNLDGIEKILIGVDYLEALRSVDRGFKARSAPKPTNEVDGVGVAMALPVKREGQLRTVVVVNAAALNPSFSGLEQPQHARYLAHLFFHEFAHAHDHELMRLHQPDWLLSQVRTDRRTVLMELGHPLWREYLAERLASSLGLVYVPEYISALEGRIERAYDDIQEKIYDYRTSNDLGGLIALAGDRLDVLLKIFSYALGVYDAHAALPGSEPLDPVKRSEGTWFESHAKTLAEVLRTLFDGYPTWPDRETAFDPVCGAIADLFDDIGMIPEDTETVGSVYWSIPLRPENTPPY